MDDRVFSKVDVIAFVSLVFMGSCLPIVHVLSILVDENPASLIYYLFHLFLWGGLAYSFSLFLYVSYRFSTALKDYLSLLFSRWD